MRINLFTKCIISILFASQLYGMETMAGPVSPELEKRLGEQIEKLVVTDKKLQETETKYVDLKKNLALEITTLDERLLTLEIENLKSSENSIKELRSPSAEQLKVFGPEGIDMLLKHFEKLSIDLKQLIDKHRKQ